MADETINPGPSREDSQYVEKPLDLNELMIKLGKIFSASNGKPTGKGKRIHRKLERIGEELEELNGKDLILFDKDEVKEVKKGSNPAPEPAGKEPVTREELLKLLDPLNDKPVEDEEYELQMCQMFDCMKLVEV